MRLLQSIAEPMVRSLSVCKGGDVLEKYDASPSEDDVWLHRVCGSTNV